MVFVCATEVADVPPAHPVGLPERLHASSPTFPPLLLKTGATFLATLFTCVPQLPQPQP